MKKVLFYSVAFAAALASCTQDAIENVAVDNAQDLSIRPELGEVVLADDAEIVTRFATGDGAQAKFEKDDKLGAAIMDAPLYSSMAEYATMLEAADGDASALYNLVSYYSSNSAFTYNGTNAWYLNADQPLVEGNYLFYAPYNASKAMRSAFEICVPETQDVRNESNNGKGALDNYYADANNVVKIGYQFLAYEDGKAQKPNVTMHDLMAYPKFTIKNNFKGYLVEKEASKNATKFFGGAIKLDRVDFINATGADLVIGGKLDHSLVQTVLTSNWKNTPFEAYTADVLSSVGQITVANGEVITSVTVDQEIAEGGMAEFYAILPAFAFAQDALQANIYVTINEKPYLISVADIKAQDNNNNESYTAVNGPVAGQKYHTASGPVTLIKGQRFPQEELNFVDGKLSKKGIAGKALTIDLVGFLHADLAKNTQNTKNGIQVAKEQVVVLPPTPPTPAVTELIDNNEEFINYFAELENGMNLIQNTALDNMGANYYEPEFNFSDENTVEINSELIDALSQYNHKGSLSIESSLPIADDVEITNISGTEVTFKSSNELTYTITLGAGYTVDADAVVSTGKSIHVLGTYDVATAAVFSDNVIIYKDAEMTINSGVQFEAKTLTNNGTLNALGVIINSVTNNGIITLGTGSYLTVGAGEDGVIEVNNTAKPDKDNISIAAGQKGVLKANAIVNKPAGMNWITELVVDATVAIAMDELNVGYAAKYAKVTLNQSLTFGPGDFDFGETVVAMKGASDLTITGDNKARTSVAIKLYNETVNNITLIKVAATGTYAGIEDKGELITDNNPTTAATWNGSAITN